MTLNIESVLKDAKPVIDYDHAHYGMKGVSPEKQEVIKGIIEKWKDDIFQETFCNHDGFEYLQDFRQLSVYDGRNSEECICLAAATLHSLTDLALRENRAPKDEELKLIQLFFNKTASSFDTENLALSKHQFQQMAIHPRLLMKCSEQFLRTIAKNLNKPNEYEFDVEKVLSENRDCAGSQFEAFRATIQKWKSDLFLDSFYTQEGISLLDKPLALPDYSTLSYVDTWIQTIQYIASVVSKANERAVGDEDHTLIRNALNSCVERFRALNSANEKYETCDDITKRLEAYTKELDEAKQALEEVKECVKAYPTLAIGLEENIAARQSELETIAKMKSSLETELQEVEKPDIPKMLASNVSESHIKEIETLSDNIPLLAICYTSFLEYAKGRSEMEVSANTGSWLGKLSWFW